MNSYDPHYEQALRKFQEYLHNAGLNNSRRKSAVLQVFVRTTKPVTLMELVYLVKKEGDDVSYHTTFHALKLFIAAGLATQIASREPGEAQQFTHQLTQCGHPHLACKDCGALVEAQEAYE